MAQSLVAPQSSQGWRSRLRLTAPACVLAQGAHHQYLPFGPGSPWVGNRSPQSLQIEFKEIFFSGSAAPG
eukprot:SAG11_NODE_4887_length_1733_cov_1.990208_1_plen_70_part_00